ncbi:30S ribosomal protein S9 [Candidatus Azambacteria bacterium]|nr:30S ribosomal protein S9 [Candidatus Azambacteria bacterium]
MAIKKQKKEKAAEIEKYTEAVGRRKTATARARLWLNAKNPEITVNGKNFTDYFKEKEMRDIVINPFVKVGIDGFAASIKITGGGLRAQAFASRHGLSRALALAQPESKPALKTLGFLTRDPRMKERKKPGLKGARRAPQWSKR